MGEYIGNEKEKLLELVTDIEVLLKKNSSEKTGMARNILDAEKKHREIEGMVKNISSRWSRNKW